MKSRKEKKPRPSNIGRRTGVDVVQGKKIRRQDDGTDVFEDYWTDNESVNSNQTTQSIQSPVKSRSDKVSENVSILDRDSVSFRNAPRSSMKRSQRSGEYEDHNSYSRSEHLRRSDVSGKENHLEIGRRTGGSVIQGKKIRRRDDGTDIYDDYWTDYDSKQASQSLRSSVETRSKRISENMPFSNRDSVDVMQTPTKYMKKSLNRGSGIFEDHDGYSSPEQPKRSGVSRGKSQLPLETMQTSDLMENRQVSYTLNSHMENSAIARSKMTQTSHLFDEIENTPSKNSTHVHNKSRKSSRADLSEGKINSSAEKYSTEKSPRISERSTMQTPDLLKNRQEMESIPSKNRTYLHNKSRKSSMANLSYGNGNSSVQKYPKEKSQRTSERSMLATSDRLENVQASSTADLHRKTALHDTLQEDLLPSRSLRRSSRYKKPPLSPLQNEQLKFVNVSAEKEYEYVEDHDDSSPEILESPSKKSRVSREKSHFLEDNGDYSSPEQSKRSGVSRGRSQLLPEAMQTSDLMKNRQVSYTVDFHMENSAIARSKMTQTSHLLDEIENTPSKNRMHTFNKSRRSNGADLSDGNISSSVRKYSTEKSLRSSERSIMQNPDVLENRQEMESIHSKNRMQMHNKSRKSSMAVISKRNANSSVQKYPSEKAPRTSESSTTETPDPLENIQEIESIPSKNKMQKKSRKNSVADLSNRNANSSVQKYPTAKSRTSESSMLETPDLLENSQEIENISSKSKMHMHKKSRKSSMADSSNVNSSVQKYPAEKSRRTSESSTTETLDLLGNSKEIENILSKSKMQIHKNSRKSSIFDLSNGNVNSSVQKHPSEKSQRTSESSPTETPDPLENSQASSTADSPVKTASQDALQEKAPSPCKSVRRSSRYKVPPLASWRNERLKFVKASAEKQYECVGVEGGRPEDDFAFQALKKKFASKVQKRKIVSWNKRQKNIPKNIKKTAIVDAKTEKTIELYLHRPFSSYEWTLPPNEPGIMICRAFKSLLITFGFLDIAGHSMKDKQVSPLDNLYFAVVKGTVKAEINTTSFIFQKGDSFIVPRGIFYSMNNETSTNALLSFCTFRIPFFNFQEKD